MPSARSPRHAAQRSPRCRERTCTVQPLRPELAPSAVLFHLAFMGQAVVKDLDHLKQRSPEGTGLEIALRLGEAAPERQASARTREIDKYFTADSDPSQEQAVMEARSAPGLVVEGPPGTGKSQTIVNIVADSIGRGKSLLVICQKQAALDVVRKRLEREKLGERIVMLTDINRDREPVVRAIREQVQALHMRPAGGAPAWRRQREQLAARIEALEGELDRHQTAMHRLDERTGLTYRTLLGELIALEAGRPKPLSLPESTLASFRAPSGGRRDDRGKLRAAREVLAAGQVRRQPAVRAEYIQSRTRARSTSSSHVQGLHRR